MINETSVLFLLLAANLMLLLVVFTALLRIDARCRRLEQFKLSILEKPETTPAVVDTSAYVNILKRLEQRFASVQKSIESAAADTVAEARPLTQSLPIENAVRMARQGASVEDLTRSCGLNIGEARLMQKLHGRTRIAAVGG